MRIPVVQAGVQFCGYFNMSKCSMVNAGKFRFMPWMLHFQWNIGARNTICIFDRQEVGAKRVSPTCDTMAG